MGIGTDLQAQVAYFILNEADGQGSEYILIAF
jgi:hypothetical protein